MRIKVLSLLAIASVAATGCSSVRPSSEEGVGETEQAAGISGSIGGTLTNAQGGGIAGATIQLNGTSQATTKSNSSGQYTFSGLGSGTYSISAVLSGCTFTPGVVNNVSIGATENFSGTGSGCGSTAPSPPPAPPPPTPPMAPAEATNGVSASIALSGITSNSYTATVTVTNGSPAPASNWQVAVNMNQSTLHQGTANAEGASIGGLTVFSPALGSKSLPLNPGESSTFTFTATITGSNYAPSIVTVDGVPNGTAMAGFPADGVDHIARAAANGALNLAIAYENNKLPNRGDSNYAQYDNLLWSAQSYILLGNTIAFDPNVPGYSYIPVQAMAALDAMQDNPSVASYLAAGLASCFADTSGQWIYNFRAGVLKGYQNDKTTTGALNGVIPPPGAFSANSPSNVVDTYSTVGLPEGSSVVSITLRSTLFPQSAQDYWFGLLTYTALSSFPNTSAVAAKFKSGTVTTCSPFNGPGGSANPYFAVTLNGANVPARFQGVGSQCQNGCTATMTIDPVAYATPGPYYNAAGLVGPQANPYGIDPSQTTASLDHFGQWASVVAPNGKSVFGMFTVPVSHRGVIAGFSWQQCGAPGAGC